jgi:hypothetical protein
MPPLLLLLHSTHTCSLPPLAAEAAACCCRLLLLLLLLLSGTLPPSVGPQPSLSADPEGFSWWVGRLLLMVGCEAEGPMRRDLLAAPTTQNRLEYELYQLGTRLEATAACAIM